MLTPLDFDRLPIPVPEEWKQRLSENLARAANAREASFYVDRDGYGVYGKSLRETAQEVCDKDMVEIVASFLIGCWNESNDFVQSRGGTVK